MHAHPQGPVSGPGGVSARMHGVAEHDDGDVCVEVKPDAGAGEAQVSHRVWRKDVAGAAAGGGDVEAEGAGGVDLGAVAGKGRQRVTRALQAPLQAGDDGDGVIEAAEEAGVAADAAHGVGVVVVDLAVNDALAPGAVLGGGHQGQARVIALGGEVHEAQPRALDEGMAGQQGIKPSSSSTLSRPGGSPTVQERSGSPISQAKNG